MTVSIVIVSKDEPALDDTLAAIAATKAKLDCACEVIVVDASGRRLDHIRESHPEVRWIDFAPPLGVHTSIPHQRNCGVRESRGDIVAFTDSGCMPRPDWISRLVAPILAGAEAVTVGRTVSRNPSTVYATTENVRARYVEECPTINVAFTRHAFDTVGGFDESFAYGSDVDFSWRLRDAGFLLHTVSDAVVSTDWGSTRRQVKRAWLYGRARARLYRKHRTRRKAAWRRDPVPLFYSAFLVGLPLTAIAPAYPLLLLIAALKNRSSGNAVLTVVDHLVYAAGFMTELLQGGPRNSAAARDRVR